LFAQGRTSSDRPLFVGSYIRTLRGAVPPETDRSLMVFSPGAKGGVVADSVVPTPGSEQISVVITPPTPPTGWLVAGVIAAAIGNVAPESDTFLNVVAATEVDPMDPVVLTGLVAAQEYVVAGWVAWTRPDGRPAYGASLNVLSTPTA
jgi:hypothetical protein